MRQGLSLIFNMIPPRPNRPNLVLFSNFASSEELQRIFTEKAGLVFIGVLVALFAFWSLAKFEIISVY